MRPGKKRELLGQTRQLLLAVSESSAVRSANPEACQEVAGGIFASYPSYANLGLMDTNGEVLASALPLAEPGNPADRDLVRRVLKTRAFAVGGYPAGLAKGKPTVTFGCPVFDASGSVQAVVVAWMGLDWFTGPGLSSQHRCPRGRTGR